VYAVRFGADSRRTKRPLQGLLRWGKFTQGKPWANLSFLATSGRMIAAKQIQTLGGLSYLGHFGPYEEICTDLCVSGFSAERGAWLAGAGFATQSGIRF
jgi:hypothetical protein